MGEEVGGTEAILAKSRGRYSILEEKKKKKKGGVGGSLGGQDLRQRKQEACDRDPEALLLSRPPGLLTWPTLTFVHF